VVSYEAKFNAQRFISIELHRVLEQSGTMCLGHNFPCGFPCCQYSGASLSSSFFQDDETQHVQDVDYHHVPTPHSLPSSSGVTVPSLPTRAQPEPSTLGDPAYAQLPPDDVLDYWICHFELTLPTTSAEDSKSATFPPSGVVTNDIDPVVSPILFIWCTGYMSFLRCVHT
jgi:hypothetical protein